MAMHQENLSAALALASAGIKIFPAGADKRPLLKGWQDAATCNADQINTWWEHAAALPAIPCGQNNLLVIDCDRHSGGADGVAAFKSLVAAHGALPRQVPLVKTPNGGLHVYFRQPNGEALGNGRGSLPPGIDVRGAGGFVVGARRTPAGRPRLDCGGRTLAASMMRRHCRNGSTAYCARRSVRKPASRTTPRPATIAAAPMRWRHSMGLRPSSPRRRLASATNASTRPRSGSRPWPRAAG